MKILLFGRNGQVARRLYQTLLPIAPIIVYGSTDLDLRDFDKLRKCIKTHKPDIIINSAAYTAVDKCESDPNNVFAINSEAVKVIAEEAAKINSWLIHYSSEYVFDGTKTEAYTEHDKPNPLGIYGQSKLAADNYIQSISPKYIILRTSWVFDSYSKNFAKTILTLAQKNDSLRIVDDQIGAPTHASLIANVTSLILYKIITNPSSSDPKKISGVYNLSSNGEVSWCGFAYALIKQVHDMGTPLICRPENVIAISSADYKTPAKRPVH